MEGYWGGVYLTGLRMELFRIQLMARWSSPVVMRYARLSPLSNITDQVRELRTSNNMANIVDRIRREVTGVTQQLAKIDDSTRWSLTMEAKAADVESQAEADKRLPEYVVNDDSKCCRRVLVKVGPPVDLVTSCSFRFGLVHHSCVAEPPFWLQELVPSVSPEASC